MRCHRPGCWRCGRSLRRRFDSVWRSVVTRPVPAMLFGAAGGPIAFLAGERLGAVTLLPPLAFGLLRLSVSWAIALVVFSAVVRQVTPERGAHYVPMLENWKSVETR